MADQLTEDQIACFTEAFQLYDKDRDGKISTSNLGQVMRSLGQHPSEKDLASLVVEICGTDSKSVDFATFLIAMARQMTKDTATEADLMEAFSIFDKCGDGTIKVEDLRQVMSNMGDRLDEEELDDICHEFAREGKVRYAELVKTFVEEDIKAIGGANRVSSTIKSKFSS